MNKPFRTQRRVEFRDTDAAGIVHFSVFFTYMEAAEHALLRHLGRSVVEHQDGVTLTWPRVAAECHYRGSVKFEDVIDIDVHVGKLGDKSVTYRVEMSHDGRRVAEGRLTAVCCLIPLGGPLQSIPIPEDFRAKLAEYLGA